MTFGEKIKYLMLKNGIEIKELANRSGVELFAIYKYLNNGSYPRVDRAVQIAKAFNISMNELLEDVKFTKVKYKRYIPIKEGEPLPDDYEVHL